MNRALLLLLLALGAGCATAPDQRHEYDSPSCCALPLLWVAELLGAPK